MIYPKAVYRPVRNHSGTMASHLGMVLHVQEGDGSLFGWFDDPGSQVSAHWWVSKGGVVEQYVDSSLEAWAQVDGNATYNSVETEGFPDQPLTILQITALAGLYRWGHDELGWPFATSDTPGQAGFAWHGMGGIAWGDHPDCPGELRRNKRTEIMQIAAGAVIIPPTPKEPPMPLPAVVQETGSEGQYVITEAVTKLPVETRADSAAFIALFDQTTPMQSLTATQLAAIPNA